MKTLPILAAILLSLVLVSPARAKGPVHVRAHVTKSGTYVPGHIRTAPNGTQRDNWSTKGNVNPYTGKAGTREPVK
jgi:hypothetical protein